MDDNLAELGCVSRRRDQHDNALRQDRPRRAVPCRSTMRCLGSRSERLQRCGRPESAKVSQRDAVSNLLRPHTPDNAVSSPQSATSEEPDLKR
jgi:hypothetical protein